MSRGVPRPKIIAIVGATASGKTALAIQLAKKFGGEIVSADSRQIYRGMDVGTAKPPRDKHFPFSILNSRFSSKGIPHHFINIRDPNEGYTVAEYKRDAVRTIRAIVKRGKVPIIVGGTGLYIQAVTDNLVIPAVKPDPKLRQKLETELKRKGLFLFFRKLVSLDPEAAYIVDPKNPRRIIRALEITLNTRKPFSSQRKRGESLFNVLEIGIRLPKTKLRERIEKRVDAMTNDGLFREVRQLMKEYGTQPAAFDAIGYREAIAYLKGKLSRAEAIAAIKKNTWNYAKRQMTWFRKDKQIYWIRSKKEAVELARVFLEIIP